MLLHRNSEGCYIQRPVMMLNLLTRLLTFLRRRMNASAGNRAWPVCQWNDNNHVCCYLFDLSSVSEFKVFKPLTLNEVTRLIKSGSIKSCSLDPLPASIMARAGVILPKYLCLRGLLTYHLLLVRCQGN